jgi:DNA-binding MarR family transcriptional regulator
MIKRASEGQKLTDVLSFRLNVLSRAIDSNAEHNSMRHINMTLLETRVTHYLHDHGPSPIASIARDMCVDAGQVSRMVVSLIEKGHARRARNPVDGRSTIISLSEAGRESVERRIHSVMRWNEILAAQVSSDEYAVLSRALDKLIDFARGAVKDDAKDLTSRRRPAEPLIRRSSGKKQGGW